MDASLSSSRYNRESHTNNSGGYRGRGSRGGHHSSSYRGGGGGGGGGGPVRYNNNHQNSVRYAPYQARGGGRFHGSPPNHHHHHQQQPVTVPAAPVVDPATVMIQTLTSMIAQMGDWSAAAKRVNELEFMDTSSSTTPTTTTTQQQPLQRDVVRILAKNIQDLVEFLCTEKNASIFLTFDDKTTAATASSSSSSTDTTTTTTTRLDHAAGPMVSLIISCTATMPTQTLCYAGLTLAMEEFLTERQVQNTESSTTTTTTAIQSPTWKANYQGFAQRCIDYACHQLFTDLDILLGLQEDFNPSNFEDIFVDTFLRCKLILRYLAILTQLGILTAYVGHEEKILSIYYISNEEVDNNNHMDDDHYDMENRTKPMSLTHVLAFFTQCAKNAWTRTTTSNTCRKLWTNVSVLLSTLVLSTIPYAMSCIPSHFIYMLLDEMESFLFSSSTHSTDIDRAQHPRYKSPFTPGKGMYAILLEHEQRDDPIDGSIMDEEQEDEDDDDEDEADGPVCADSLQDLFRNIRKLTQGFYDSMSCSSNDSLANMTQFCFLWDQPWSCLSRTSSDSSMNIREPEQNDNRQLVYTGKSIYMIPPQSSRFLSIFSNVKNSDQILTMTAFQCHRIDGVVFGRLAMFENLADDDDEDQPADQTDNTQTPMDIYIKSFNTTDRYFLNDVVRDVLIAYRPKVTVTGVEKGSCKEVAEQLWSIHYLFSPKNQLPNSAQNWIRGIEYGMIESLMTLVLQSPSTALSNSSPLSRIYLSRVILELIKHQPRIITPCLAVAVSLIFEHVIPTLTPCARENFTTWFSFHLTNTDYQWSSDCWNLWAPYAVKGLVNENDKDALEDSSPILSKRNCRGEFVSDAVHIMMELVASPDIVATECIPHQRALVEFIGSSFHESVTNKVHSPTLEDVEQALMEKIWKHKEDPSSIEDYLLKETTSLCQEERTWLRTGLITRSLFYPASTYRVRLDGYMKSALEDATISSENETNDILRDVGDTLQRYKNVIIAALTRDTSVVSDVLSRSVSGGQVDDLAVGNKLEEDKNKMEGYFFVITEMKRIMSFSDSLFHACLVMLVKMGIISEFSVLRWSLGERGLESSSDCYRRITKQWWKLSASVMSAGISTRMMTTDLDVTDDGKLLTLRITLVTDFVKEMLTYASEFIDKENLQQQHLKQPSAGEVELKEGLKTLKNLSVGLVISAIKEDKHIGDYLKNSNSVSVENLVESFGLK